MKVYTNCLLVQLFKSDYLVSCSNMDELKILLTGEIVQFLLSYIINILV